MSSMHIGLLFANGARAAEPDHAATLAVAAEAAGYESLWTAQHVVLPVSYESRYPYAESGTLPGSTSLALPDPLVWLAWVGALTSRIRLATGVFILPQQHPLVVAKQVATLDRLTGGRVILGVGAGWLREEFEALGADFDQRGRRLDESIEVLRRAWSPGPTTFDGATMSFPPVHVEPTPSNPIPIIVGGHTEAAARRAGRVGDGYFPIGCDAERLTHLVGVMRTEAERLGRDVASLELTVDAPRDAAQAELHRRLGVARVVVYAPNVASGALADALASKLDRLNTVLGHG
jgi:probable F420-dependent oxidoreductase